MVHQDHLDQYLDENLLDITHIQVERAISFKNQHQYLDQLINMNLYFCNKEVTSVNYPQADSKGLTNCLYHNVSYTSIMMDRVINIFSTNEVRSHFHIYDDSIITFGII